MMHEVTTLPAGDGWELRIVPKGWGLIGPRHLKGEASFPSPYKNLSEEDLGPAMEAWQKFIDEQDKRLSKRKRK
tara:strand:- start:862 stop:1083 length:222 start_codon:yes stop_codon:yes gene_type:complete